MERGVSRQDGGLGTVTFMDVRSEWGRGRQTIQTKERKILRNNTKVVIGQTKLVKEKMGGA